MVVFADVIRCDIKRYAEDCFADLCFPLRARLLIYSLILENAKRFRGASSLVLVHYAYHIGRDNEAVGSKCRPIRDC